MRPKEAPGFNATNLSSTDGDLVTEAICVGTVTQSDAVVHALGTQTRVTIPSAGERVRITGTYVLDADHGWMEIHPIGSDKGSKALPRHPPSFRPQGCRGRFPLAMVML
jgi:hypothetical protein